MIPVDIRRYLIRNLRGMDHFELFMVSAIASILAVRLFLEITGYPQIGGSTLHIAHAEWGGLLMALSIVVLLILMNRRVQSLAAVGGGIGFGLFVDEVGKFITQSNDYFFQPSVAIMYVTFVAFYMIVRYVLSSQKILESEYLVNAIHEMEEIPAGGILENEQQEILFYLSRCDQSNPMVRDLKEIAHSTYAEPPRKPGFYRHWRSKIFGWYRKVAHSRLFTPLITTFFILQFIGAVSVMIALMFDPGEIIEQLDAFKFTDWAILGSNIISAVLIGWGVLLLRRSRLRAFIMFQRSILVAIFIGQFFLFYKDEFGALSGLIFDLLVYAALRFLIEREREEEFEGAAA